MPAIASSPTEARDIDQLLPWAYRKQDLRAVA
jgi:hypothetical protein